MSKKVLSLMGVLVALSLVLAACATPTPQVVVQTQVVKETQVVVETQEVTVTQVVAATPEPQADRVQIYWYIGLGAGSQPAQIPLEKAFADKFNASQDRIQLIPIIVNNPQAQANLTAQIAAGNAPDIVGPVGTAGRAAFPGAFLDLEPLIAEFNYDTSDIDPAFLDFYKDEGKLVGLPFAIFPSMVFVNKDLFDEAGLAYPPQKVGEKYKWPDGTEEDWTFDTVAKLARRLTVDANGNDATSPDFDRNNIVQYGFNFQWNGDPRAFGTYFGAFYPIDASGNAVISEEWKTAWKYYYDGIWGEQPFIPTGAADSSDLLKGNAFSSGKVAMGLSHLWYTCCIDTANVPNLDIAIVPSHNGKITSKMHGDTFAIMSGTQHPKEAFEVYTYMLGEGAQDLYGIYGGLPARTSQQAAFFEGLDERFAPNKINWQVALDMIPYLDAPNHELGLGVNNTKANTAFSTLGSDFTTNDSLDMDARIEQFIQELDTILHETPGGN